MKLAHNIRISVFIKEGEDEKTTEETLKTLLPGNTEKEKITIKKTIATGFNEKKIIILETTLEKERHTRKFLENINQELSPEDKKLLTTQENRLDENMHYYLRLDKEKLEEGIMRLTDKGNCYHIRISLAAYPKNKETAKKLIKEIFK